MAKKGSMFTVLRERQSSQQPNQEAVIEDNQSSLEVAKETPPKTVATEEKVKPKKGVGRPPGRRSDPSYTQLSAYVPLELLISVQDKLARERRVTKQRTVRPVSDLIEKLLDGWLKQQKRGNSDS